MAHFVGLRVRALVAVGAVLGSLGLPPLSFGHFTFDDDRACGSVELIASHPGFELGPVKPTLPADHCALCHWLRAVGGARTAGVVTVHAWLEASALIVDLAPVWRIAPSLHQHVSR